MTTTSTGPSLRPPGPLARWARFAVRNPWRVIAVWVILIAVLGVAKNRLGGEYVNQFEVPGSDSQAAIDLLNDRFPDAAGDTVSLVFQAPAGIFDPAARSEIDAVLAQAAQLPGVTGVTSPFDVPEQVSDDGTIAYATLQYATAAIDVPTEDAEALFALVDASSRAWYIPVSLDRILPRVSIEGPAEPDPLQDPPPDVSGRPAVERQPTLSRQS